MGDPKREKPTPTWSERFWKWLYRDHGSESLPTGGAVNPWDEEVDSRQAKVCEACEGAAAESLVAMGAARDQLMAERDEAREEVERLKALLARACGGYQPTSGDIDPVDLKPPRGDTAIVSAMESMSVDAIA